ncbi:hypothetical protein RCJ22_14230, partial [Vibrio sp. FNV 38]|nr:hypothetical protein [Vibrio sp. FNV 38]
MIELIIHPGHAKCGSTTIQDFLYNNRLELKKRGIFMPDSEFNFPGDKGYKINRTHTPRDYFEKVIRGEVDVEIIAKKLDTFLRSAEQNSCKKIIITAENLVNGIGSKQQKSVHNVFSQRFDKIKVIYYIRNQEDLLVSAWQQWGHKKGIGLDDYISDTLKTKFGDYSFIADKLKSYYKNSSFKICPLDKERLVQGSLTRDFCVRAGLNNKGLIGAQESSNLGLSTAICNSLSKIDSIYESPHSQKVKNIILSLTTNSHKLVNKKYSYDISQNTKEAIEKRFFESNLNLSKNYFDGNSV